MDSVKVFHRIRLSESRPELTGVSVKRYDLRGFSQYTQQESNNPSFSSGKATFSAVSGAESGALAITDPGLAELVEAWVRLPEAMKAGILAMVKAAHG